MAFTIEIDDRGWDVENLLNALTLPAKRRYVAEITVDEPEHGQIIFTGDAQLVGLDDDVLLIQDWDEDTGEAHGPVTRILAADIRRISFY